MFHTTLLGSYADLLSFCSSRSTLMAHARQAELGYVWIARDHTSSFVQGHVLGRFSWRDRGTTTGAARPHRVVAHLDGETREHDELVLWHDPGRPGDINIPPAPPRPAQPRNVWVWSGTSYDKCEFVRRCIQEDSSNGTPHRILYTNGTVRGSPVCQVIEDICWQRPCEQQGNVRLYDIDGRHSQEASPLSARTTAKWRR